MKLGLIDYGAGNLQSVRNSLEAAGQEACLVRGSQDMAGLTHLVLPGVGAFGDCARGLESQGLAQPIREWIAAGKPFLGICIGYQILFESSEESPGVAGLGIFKGHVRRFSESHGLKIPHMGWNEVEQRDPQAPIWAEMKGQRHFYFVHSFFPQPEDENLVCARCKYGDSFAAAIQLGKVVATQFHPEKSQQLGIQLLRNFLQL